MNKGVTPETHSECDATLDDPEAELGTLAKPARCLINKNATQLFDELLDVVITQSCCFSELSGVALESGSSKTAVDHSHLPSTQWQRAK